MTDFCFSWSLSRQRLFDEIKDLGDHQLRWKLHENSLSIGEMALHVAGVEVLFASQLLQRDLSPDLARIRSAATDGVVNDLPFPFSSEEITWAAVSEALAQAKEMLEPVIESPSPEMLDRQIRSALGPMVSGTAALARMAFHPAYHQGQAYLIKTSPDFPA